VSWGDLARLGAVRRPHSMRPSPPSQCGQAIIDLGSTIWIDNSLNPRIVGDDVVGDPANNRLVGRSVLSEKSVLGIGNGIHPGLYVPKRGALIQRDEAALQLRLQISVVV